MRSLLLILLLSVGTICVLADDQAPQWLQEASHLASPAIEMKDVPALVLRSEERISVDSDGMVVRVVRYAVRILTKSGKDEAVAHIAYLTDSEKVKDLNAWLIRRSGPTKSYGKKDVVDIALVENSFYDEVRAKYISAKDVAEEGDVFGYETTTELRQAFSQFEFSFQDDLPVVFASFNLSLPSGWRASGVTFNRPAVEPAINGSSYSWELRDLAPIPLESGSPRWSSIAPRLAVSFFPAQATATQIRSLENWNDVAKWMSELEDPRMLVNDGLAAKALELTAGAKTELDRIRAIGAYVQQIQYISIQTGLGRGGGYVPHTSTDVFAKSYGDCKDKANLMRAMLSVLRIPAFMVSITADDPTYVRAEWASPTQFNHCIIAIKVSDATQASSVVTHPTLGRLLIFDPTDPYTQVGDIPEKEQGSLFLVDHKDSTSLTKMPVMPAESNRLERSIEYSISPSGDVTGKVTEDTNGQTAARERANFRRLSAPEYHRMIEGWVSRGLTGAKTTKIVPLDDRAAGTFNLNVEFSAPAYAQIMQGRLMVFKPAIIGRLERLTFTDGKRQHPYLIDETAYSESTRIKLPQGFAVDEVPESSRFESAFGKYSVSYEVKGDELITHRSLVLSRSTIPADKYESVRSFFGRVRAAEQSPVVLVRK